jgi:hypothetical protein
VLGVPGSPPPATGGTIADGTYYLTSRVVYQGTDGGTDGGTLYTIQETIVFTTSNGIRIVQDIQNTNGQPNQTVAASVFASDSTAFLTELCPNTAQKASQYTDGPNGEPQESVFTKQ